MMGQGNKVAAVMPGQDNQNGKETSITELNIATINPPLTTPCVVAVERASTAHVLKRNRTDQSPALNDKSSIKSIQFPISVAKRSATVMNSTFFNHNKVGSTFQDQNMAFTTRQLAAQQQMIDLAENQTRPTRQSIMLAASLRKTRDSGSLLAMLIFLSALGYVIWDGMTENDTDINLIVHGHDSYGNICGRNNKPIRFVDKSGKNYTDKPYTKYTLIDSRFERYTVDSVHLKKYGELVFVKDTTKQGRKTGVTGGLSNEFDTNNGGEMLYEAPPSSRSRATRYMERLITDEALHVNTRRPANVKNNSIGYEANKTSNTAYSRDGPAINGSGFAQQQLQSQRRRTAMPQPRNGAMFSLLATTTHIPIPRPGGARLEPPSTSALNHNVTKDSSGNDGDLFAHTLVEPKNTTLNELGDTQTGSIPINTRASTGDRVPYFTDTLAGHGYNIGMGGTQLLYLTECVSSCPSDHLELIFYRCLPSKWRFSLFPNAINVTRTFIDDVLTDVSHCYRELIYTFSLALVLSLVLLISLRFLAGLIIWSCILCLISLFVAMASYSWLTYYYQILDLNNLMPHEHAYSERFASADKWLIGSIFLTFIAFAAIATVIFMRSRILLVTMLFRESGKAIADMPLLLLQPILTFAALLGITITFCAGLVCLQSMKLPVIDKSTGFVVFKAETLYKIMKWYHIFAFLWVSHFAIACQHYVIGASVSKWYFAPSRYNLGSPIGASTSELFVYYLGSVALGSFLVAIFKVFRIIVRQIQYLVQRNCASPPHSNQIENGSQSSPGGNSSCCGSFTYIWRLFIWFFDNIVMIINRDAYVEVAIHGHSFLSGAKRAFEVLASNPLRLLAIKSVSNILLMVAKICVVFGTISVAAVLLEEKNHQLNYTWSPIIITAIYAYVVAHWFLSVYEMVIDALFICYCEDYELSKTREQGAQMHATTLMNQILGNNLAQ